jgi:signal peptidase I
MAGTPHACQAAKTGLASEVLRSFGELRLQVGGSSMLPSIYPGDILTVHRTEIARVVPGDIVLYTREDRLYAHRIVEKICDREGILLLTRGDTLAENDPPVSAAELLGRVASIVRGPFRIAPGREPSAYGRVVAGLVRRSTWFAALVLRLHGLRRRWIPDLSVPIDTSDVVMAGRC